MSCLGGNFLFLLTQISARLFICVKHEMSSGKNGDFNGKQNF